MTYRCPICNNAITGGTGERHRARAANRLRGHFVRKHREEVADPEALGKALIRRETTR